MAIDTEPLLFLPIAPNYFLALKDGPDTFRKTFAYSAADGLRNFIVSGDVSPETVASLNETSDFDPWRWGFFIVHKPTLQTIGMAGFKGPPNAEGIVEIAYAIVPSFENNGYATIAAKHLVQFAHNDSRVQLVCAHTLPTSNASTRVLEKTGFRQIGTIEDPDDGTIWRWQHDNPVG